MKETELGWLLLDRPDLARIHGELLAALSFADGSLDRLRHELLNLAASNFRLESRGLRNHLVAKGMADLVARFDVQGGRFGVDLEDRGGDDADDREAHFLRVASSLRDMAELEPERQRAVQRFNDEPTEETWAEAQRLLANRAFSND